MKKPAIAVFGGTFNPIHIGHEEMISAICELSFIDRLLVMPSKIPPHKSVDFLARDLDRVNMCRLVTDNYEKAELCEMELTREGKSYTVDTLKELLKLYPENSIYLVIGGDMLSSFTTWRSYEEILKLASLLVFKRAGEDVSDFDNAVLQLKSEGADVTVLETEIREVSSTEIREALLNNNCSEKLLPKKVLDYITKQKVYDYQNYKGIIREKLDDYRYNHSLSVAVEAARLAGKYGGDEDRAYLAGLLHDITKNFSREEHLQIVRDFDIILTDTEKNAPKLWHAITGSAYLKNILKINDDEIISAVRYHTTGKADMSLLELIIFIADFTSADRNYPDVDVMRALSYKSLYEAAVYALDYTIKDLEGMGATVHPDTLSAYEYFKSKIN